MPTRKGLPLCSRLEIVNQNICMLKDDTHCSKQGQDGHTSPSRLSMMADLGSREVSPKGQPSTARICCSNCEVTHASIV